MPRQSQKNEDESSNPDIMRVSHDNIEKKRMEVRAKDTPGIICLEKHTHDDAIIISGSLVVDIADEDLNTWIAQELESAGLEIKKNGGMFEQIKTTLAITTTSTVSLTDNNATIKKMPLKRARITLAAIIHKMDSDEALQIIRKALATVRRRLRQEKS